MTSRGLFSKLARLSSWSTLAVGIGAASNVVADVGQTPAQAINASGVAQLKIENGRVYLADSDGLFRSLTLGSTPEAAEFTELLSRLSPDGSIATVPVGRLIVADGGQSSSASRTTEAQRKSSSGK
jgi:hypothetical protein